MHSNAKIMGKLLANRLSPHLNNLVSHSQTVFIKGRSILDNFQYMQGAVNHFHRSKTPMLFLKLKATEQGILSQVGSDPIRIRTSLYADDASFFLKPTQQDLTAVQRVLAAFGTATGLEANIRRRYNKLAVVNLH